MSLNFTYLPRTLETVINRASQRYKGVMVTGMRQVGKSTMLRRILGVVFGSCLYRFIVAVALRFNVPAAAMKLVSAIIVAIAISMPAIKEKIAFEQRKHGACRRRVTTGKEGK
jgi:putative ABC transport system permease protein